MEGVITINKIVWHEQPDIPQPVSIAYRLKSDPDEDRYYTIAGTGIIVAVDGIIAPAFEIMGLDRRLEYTVKVTTVCGLNVFKKDFIVSGDVAAYSVGFSLGFFS